jgi:ABC-type bacteriocin/lantibiotic exporter with double-glycine peptidase domain
VRISTSLYSSYINRDIEFHQKHNSSELIKNIYGVGVYLNNYVFGIVTFFTELILGLGLVVILLNQSKITTIVIVAICYVGSQIVHKLTKRAMSRAGKQVSDYTAKRLEVLQDGFDGIAEINIYDKRDFFSESYKKYHEKTAEAEREFEVYSNITAPIFEFIIVTSISISMIGFVTFGQNVEKIIPLMAVYIAVAFRFIPSFGRIINIFQQFEYGRIISQIIDTDLRLEANEIQNTPFSVDSNKESGIIKSIEIENVSFSYRETSQNVLTNFNFVFQENKIYGIVGKSGAGKSTLMKLMTGLLKPTEGTILYGGTDIWEDKRAWQSKIGYVPQNIFIMDSSIKDNVEFGKQSGQHSDFEVLQSLKEAGLHDFLEEKVEGLQFKVGEHGNKLSGGQRQRLGIARALFRQPEILFLDEATSGLDKATETEILSTIATLRRTLTIVIISHSDEVMEIADSIVDLDQLGM